MPALFISHSHKDDAATSALESWLLANGFTETDIFVDHVSIAGGAKWRDELRTSAGACRVVVCLVTANWLVSNECFNEFRAAWYMGKRIIPLFALSSKASLSQDAKKRLAEISAEDQGLDLSACLKSDGTIKFESAPNVAKQLQAGLCAAGALAKIGLDPEAFAIDRKLVPVPFPGLASFGDGDADAALFYGRSREIAEALETLRQMRANGERKPFVILGASGSGKSSLLKAGIVPRMRREAPAWLPLRVFRPGADPLLNFAEALARTLADFGKVEAPGVIRDRLHDPWRNAARTSGGLTPAGFGALQAALEAEGQRLREVVGRNAATILLSIDQSEELARAEDDSGEALADYLRTAVAAATHWQLVLTIRTDSFPELQGHRRFQGLEARPFDLRVLPEFRYESVVEAPARRYGVTVAPALIDALMEDAPQQDALPLLAFALQRLWRQYAASGGMTKDDYDRVGGLKGLIEDAAERALRSLNPDVTLPSGPPSKLLDDLGASTFVPALAQINDQGAIIRRIAAWDSFKEAQRELLDRFDQWRLVRKGESDGGTVEVAHEALLREWTRLKGWLEPQRARLESLRSLQVDAANWERNGKNAGFLNHRNRRLAETEALARIEGYGNRLGKVEFDYLAACREAEDAALARARRVQWLVAAPVVLLTLVGAGWLEQDFLREQYVWRWKMGLSVLTVAEEQKRTADPKSEFRECAVGCPTMVVVPAGTFTMGSPKNERYRSGDEGPQHGVTIAKPFAAGKTEVTFAEWDTCVAAGACSAAYSSWGRGDEPVINVSWDDAKQYASWLSRMTGKPYRLLTEAEWEYAARAGNSGRYDEVSDDEAQLDRYAWYFHNSDNKAHPVRKKAANSFGLHDMHGNVWEWVEDPWHDSYEGAPTDGSPWLKEGDDNRHVVRGGSWINYPQFVRAASRVGFTSDVRGSIFGFRLARTLNH
jgi:formylglycine-generating enzyme required for sulfatase activity